MPAEEFFEEVKTYLETFQRLTGVDLDVRLTGHRIAQSVLVDIEPAIQAIVKTEMLIRERMRVDLRELEDVRPPVPDNLFVAFTAQGVQFRGGNVDDFGILATRLPASVYSIGRVLESGAFIPGGQVADVYVLVVFVRTPSGEIGLARSGVVVGLEAAGRLVSYLPFETNRGVGAAAGKNEPSRLAGADRQVMLYVFLALSAFMAANQGESPVRWDGETRAVIG